MVLSGIDCYFRFSRSDASQPKAVSPYQRKTPNTLIHMVSKVTDGVKVTVLTEYQPDYSNPGQDHFVFTYKILIENHSEHTVKLLRRHWLIYDANGTVREVEGAGIVGLQPILEPGDVHDYVSGCNLRTDLGKMAGTYLMERVLDGRQFRVIIPAFSLVAPYRMN
ncbi:ApaG protein [Dyadobacter psychrophilus]|uniref:ApaG protein n=2 Tax=Dyadobacter psychrophilus TaxID=651661 RepID=A0A1T5DMB5_9BACT|nr:ApaG protein [Dyadobacter psychrophilus]